MSRAGPTVLALVAVAVACAPPLAARAGEPGDYVRGWPVVLQSPDAGAHRVLLEAAHYRTLTRSGLEDLEVFDASGAAVPAAILGTDPVRPVAVAGRALPWFPLPPGADARARELAIVSERDDQGRLQRLEARLATREGPETRPATAWLIDARAAGGRVTALGLQLDPAQGPVDARYRVEGSDDLQDWRTLQDDLPVLVLAQDGRSLRRVRLPVDADMRYLRVVPTRAGGVLALRAVTAEVVPAADPAAWRWLELAPTPVPTPAGVAYEYTLDGRFPVDRVDVGGAGDDAGEWRAWSRDVGDGADADAAWVARAGPWIAYRMGRGADAEQSAPQVLDAPSRDRHWRLVPAAPVATPPTLRVGYRPEAVVFVARGTPPYLLAIGSARTARAAAPVAGLVDAIRARRGAGWEPAGATVAAPRELGGRGALQPAAPVRDWKSWLLWSLLVAGALLVAGFAATLLRRPPADGPPHG